MKAGDEKATIAITAAGYRIKKYVGSFAAALNGVDAIVFTGGIGEHSDVMRNLVAGDMQYLGVELDPELNKKFVSGYDAGIYEIQSASSRVKVLVATTNEELSIARETKALVENL